MHFTIFTPLHPSMLYAKFGWKWFGSFREEAKNVQTFTNIERRSTNDDGQNQIAIGHLSDSGDPIREQNRIYILEINFETNVCKISQFGDHTYQ